MQSITALGFILKQGSSDPSAGGRLKPAIMLLLSAVIINGGYDIVITALVTKVRSHARSGNGFVPFISPFYK